MVLTLSKNLRNALAVLDAEEAPEPTGSYSPDVERWRPLVEREFKARGLGPDQVDKALYVIEGESGGNPGIANPTSSARGLVQMTDVHGIPESQRLDPEFSVQWMADRVARQGWTDWGEGVTYEGKPFGILGLKPYPGGPSAPTGSAAGGVTGRILSTPTVTEAGLEDTPLRSRGTLRSRLRDVPDEDYGYVETRPHTEDTGSPLKLLLRGLGAANELITPVTEPVIEAGEEGLTRGLQALQRREGIASGGYTGGTQGDPDAAEAAAGVIAPALIPRTGLDLALTVGTGPVKTVGKLGTLMRGTRGADEALSVIGGKADEAVAAYNKLRAAGFTDEDIAQAFGEEAVQLGKGALTHEALDTARRATADAVTDVYKTEGGITKRLRKTASDLSSRMGIMADEGTQAVEDDLDPLVAMIRFAQRLGSPQEVIRERIFEGQQGAATGRTPVPVQARFPGEDFAPPAPEKQHWLTLDNVLGALGAPRSVMTTADVGNIGRQNLPLSVRHPKIGAKVVEDTIAAFRSEEAAQAAREAVESSPLFKDATEKYGLRFWNWGEDVASADRVPGFEGLNQSQVSKWVEKFPFMRNSERAMATGQNVQGMRVFEKWAEPILANPNLDEATKTKRLIDLASVINHWRGFSGSRAANWLNATGALFSGQYTVSRGQVLVDPVVMMMRGSPEARNLAAQTLFGFMGSNAAMLGLLAATGEKTGGWSVNFNPTSSDFGQLRIGNTRFDTLAGLGPVMKTVSRMSALAADGAFGTEWAREGDRLGSVLLRFFENKEQPIARMITDGLLHNKLPELGDLKNLAMPMLVSGLIETIANEQGANKALAIPAAAASLVGVGTNTYETEADKLAGLDGLDPLARIAALDKLRQSGDVKKTGAEKKAFETARDEAGFKDFWEAPRKREFWQANVDLDVQNAYWNKGSVHSAGAADKLLALEIPGLEVKLSGMQRAITQDENSRRAWEDAKDALAWYIEGDWPQERDREARRLYKKPFAELGPTQMGNVMSNLREAIRKSDEELDAYLYWFGAVSKPLTKDAVRYVEQELYPTYGSRGFKTGEDLAEVIGASFAPAAPAARPR